MTNLNWIEKRLRGFEGKSMAASHWLLIWGNSSRGWWLGDWFDWFRLFDKQVALKKRYFVARVLHMLTLRITSPKGPFTRKLICHTRF